MSFGVISRAAAIVITITGTLAAASIGFAQQPISQSGVPALQTQLTRLSEAELYRGWRASRVLGKEVASKQGKALGEVRNILVRADGQIEAFIVEASASAETLEFVFRVPWQRVVREELPHRLVVDIPDNRLPAYKLLLDPTTTRREFRVTEVIGDYARLQTGFAFGYVVDVVFTAARPHACCSHPSGGHGGWRHLCDKLSRMDEPMEPSWRVLRIAIRIARASGRCSYTSGWSQIWATN